MAADHLPMFVRRVFLAQTASLTVQTCVSQPEADGIDAVDETALDKELAALRGSIAEARRGLTAGRAELRVMDRDLAAAGAAFPSSKPDPDPHATLSLDPRERRVEHDPPVRIVPEQPLGNAGPAATVRTGKRAQHLGPVRSQFNQCGDQHTDVSMPIAGKPEDLAEQAVAVAGKENVAQDIAALVSGARRLQPLLAKAERLRRAAKDTPRRREEVDGTQPLQTVRWSLH